MGILVIMMTTVERVSSYFKTGVSNGRISNVCKLKIFVTVIFH